MIARLSKQAAAVTAITGALVVLWAVLADHPARPALKREVDLIAQQAAANTKQVLWLQLNNYERLCARRPLTRREEAEYLKIARLLGVPPRCR